MTITATTVLTALLKKAADGAKKYAMSDEPDVGVLAGDSVIVPMGVADGKKIYEFRNDLLNPERFIHTATGYEFKAGNFFGTDGASTPAFTQKIFPRKYIRLDPLDFIEAAVIHDHICRMGWIWVRNGPTGQWTQMLMSKKQADVLFHMILSAPTIAREGKQSISATRTEAFGYYQAVRKAHAAQGE
jgi:hypothetical protein